MSPMSTKPSQRFGIGSVGSVGRAPDHGANGKYRREFEFTSDHSPKMLISRIFSDFLKTSNSDFIVMLMGQILFRLSLLHALSDY